MSKMSKAEPTTTTATTTETKEAPKLLTVKANQKFRGARAAWYEQLLTLEGKTEADVEAALNANPPSVRTARSKFAGQPEPASGWIRWFKNVGVAEFK